jgi:hypothetical protein
MIRFICQKCRKAVRVPDDSGGKKGICPFCKQLILIPIHDDPTIDPALFDEIRGLDDTSMRLPVLSNMDETDLDIPEVPDLSQDTVRIDAPTPGQPKPAMLAPRLPPSSAAADGGTKRLYSLLMAVAVVVLAVGASSVWYSLRHGRVRTDHAAARTAGPAATPAGASDGKPAVSTAMIPILRHVPSGTFGLLHVDFARCANMLSQVGPNDPPPLRQAAALPYWANAPEKCSQGIIPVTMTLYVVSTFEPTGTLFGPWYGVHSDGQSNPQQGPWTLWPRHGQSPHFLFHLTGSAAHQVSAALLAEAKQLKLADNFAPDLVATSGRLRMAPAWMDNLNQGEEMFLGTTQTLSDRGRPAADADLAQQLDAMMRAVPADRAIVGFVRVEQLRQCLGNLEQTPRAVPLWATPETTIVFSLDPSPSGAADIVIGNYRPGGLSSSDTGGMTMTTEGEEVRLTGTGAQAAMVLAAMLPGLDGLAARSLEYPVRP